MNVLIVNGSASPKGGAEKVALDTAVGLAARGHRVTVLAAHGPIAPELKAVPNLQVKTADPNPPRALANVLERVSYLWPKNGAELLKDHLSDGEPNSVIHFHSGYLEFGIPGFSELVRGKSPIVYTHHDYAWGCPLMGFYDYRRQATCPLVGGSLACLSTDCVNSHVDKWIRFGRHLGTHQLSGIGKRIAEHVFVSRTSFEKLSPYLGADPRHTILPNPTDFERECPVEISENSRFAWVGRLTVEKDPGMMAEAASIAEVPVRFIGDGPLKEQVQKLNPAAEMAGWCQSSEVRRLLGSARALVMTSRWLEAAPLVLAEAFCRGLPAVVPSETAAAEFVDHGNTGLVYESRNIESLVENLVALKDFKLAAKLGDEAYRRFWANPPTMAAHLDGLEAIYARAAAGYR